MSTNIVGQPPGPLVAPARHRFRIVVVTSCHPDFDARLWKYAQLLRRVGHEVHLVCPWDVPEGEGQGVWFHPFRRFSSRRARFVKVQWRLGRRLLPLLRHVDLVHFHDFDILPLMTIVALFKPAIYDVHENYPEEMLVRDWIPQLLRRPLAWAVRWMQLACAAVIRNIILVSEFRNAELYGPTLRKAIVRNYATVDLLGNVKQDYMERSDGVIFLGSQHKNNGSNLLLEIADRLRVRLPGIKVYAVDRFGSNAAYRQALLQEVVSRGLEETYVLLPNVKPHEVMQHLNRCTIAVTPNLRVAQQIFGAHNKLFEYMAAALPIVASDLPHDAELLSRCKAGLLAQPENPASFVDAICRLVADREYARELGRNGQRAFLAHYSWESQAATIQSFYERILLGKSLDKQPAIALNER